MSNSAEIRNIIDSIRKICGVDKFIHLKIDICSVDSVDEDNRQINCTSILNGADVKYLKVNLSAESNDGYILIPAINSTVIVAQLPNNECYCLQFSDIDKIICVIDNQNSYVFDTNGFVFNGGTNGGMVIVANLVSKLNRLENTFNTHVHTGVTIGSSSSGVPATPITPITQESDLENNKVKH